LDQRAILRQALAPLTDLLDRSIVLVLHLGDRVVTADRVGQLVELRLDGLPDLRQDHGRPRISARRSSIGRETRLSYPKTIADSKWSGPAETRLPTALSGFALPGGHRRFGRGLGGLARGGVGGGRPAGRLGRGLGDLVEDDAGGRGGRGGPGAEDRADRGPPGPGLPSAMIGLGLHPLPRRLLDGRLICLARLLYRRAGELDRPLVVLGAEVLIRLVQGGFRDRGLDADAP